MSKTWIGEKDKPYTCSICGGYFTSYHYCTGKPLSEESEPVSNPNTFTETIVWKDPKKELPEDNQRVLLLIDLQELSNFYDFIHPAKYIDGYFYMLGDFGVYDYMLVTEKQKGAVVMWAKLPKGVKA